MARSEHDREDLLREATALVERVELQTVRETEPLVIGFRRDGCASVYFGQDPAYHFNARNELRRAYVAGQLWKADGRRLIAIDRERTDNEVQLITRELPLEVQDAALAGLHKRLAQLADDLAAPANHSVIGQVPADADVLARVRAWLAALDAPIVIALRPHAL